MPTPAHHHRHRRRRASWLLDFKLVISFYLDQLVGGGFLHFLACLCGCLVYSINRRDCRGVSYF